jgi:hypothetical protein
LLSMSSSAGLDECLERDPSREPPMPHEQNLPQQISARQWWPLPNLSAAPPRGPPSTSSSNFGGVCCRTRWQHPQGAHHRRLLQFRWWPLPELLTAPPMGPAINVFFKLRWWPLSDPPTAPTGSTPLPGGLPSMSSSTSVVTAAGPAGSTPRGPAINVFLSYGGGHC